MHYATYVFHLGMTVAYGFAVTTRGIYSVRSFQFGGLTWRPIPYICSGAEMPKTLSPFRRTTFVAWHNASRALVSSEFSLTTLHW